MTGITLAQVHVIPTSIKLSDYDADLAGRVESFDEVRMAGSRACAQAREREGPKKACNWTCRSSDPSKSVKCPFTLLHPPLFWRPRMTDFDVPNQVI